MANILKNTILEESKKLLKLSKEELINRGAKVAASISTRTDLLIVGKNPGSKLGKAKDLEIDILREQEVENLLLS